MCLRAELLDTPRINIGCAAPRRIQRSAPGERIPHYLASRFDAARVLEFPIYLRGLAAIRAAVRSRDFPQPDFMRSNVTSVVASQTEEPGANGDCQCVQQRGFAGSVHAH